jgi:hypothetical protein
MPSDLETRLRAGLQATADDVDPAPRDLADRVRHRARAQRRTRLAVAAAGVAAALVFVGVPVVTSTLLAEGGTAAPAERTSPAPPPLDELPTRGSLAGDAQWLDAVAALSWQLPDVPPDAGLQGPTVTDRRVVYAGDTPTGRVALVVGREGSILWHVWFTGPAGAGPAEMSPATPAGRTADQGRLALLDAAGPEADEATLVLVARPGDSATWTPPPVVAADGSESTRTLDLPMEDGVVVTGLAGPVPWATAIEVHRDGRLLVTVGPEPTTRVTGEEFPTARPADPRGLAERLDATWLGLSTRALLDSYGLTAAEADPTLLAAGPLDPEWSPRAWLVGFTFPSGATGLQLEGEAAEGTGMSGFSYRLPHGPAGTALLDRVVVVRALGGIVVSAPATAVTAEVLDARGTVLGSLPLEQGAGTGPLAVHAVTARLLAADGTVVAEVPIEGVQ